MATKLWAVGPFSSLAAAQLEVPFETTIELFNGLGCQGPSTTRQSVWNIPPGGGQIDGPFDGIFASALLKSDDDVEVILGVCGRGFSCQEVSGVFGELNECLEIENGVDIDKLCTGSAC